MDFPDRIHDTQAHGNVVEVYIFSFVFSFRTNGMYAGGIVIYGGGSDDDDDDDDDSEAPRARASQRGSGRMSENAVGVSCVEIY